VVYQAGPIARGRSFSENQANPRSAGIDNPVHALRATVETLGGATTKPRLIVSVSVKTGHNHICYLLD
jgi:hypothetical protein